MKNYLDIEKCLVWLDSFLGFEYKHKKIIVDSLDETTSTNEFISLVKEYIESNLGDRENTHLLSSFSSEYINFLIENLDKNNIKITTYLSSDYPQSLFEIDCPPIVLYYKGNIELVDGDTFAIVGSRKSLPLSISLTKNYAKELLASSFTLITGIAEGVDTAVLTTALENNGKVISVIAGGLNNIYPKKNFELLEEVSKGGLVLSEYPPQVQPKPFHFPIRNRIIAGLSKGVLIVSGSIKSGTLYTAEYANDYNKDLFAIPYSVGVPSGAGCNDLIKKGALLTDSPLDIINFYGKNKEKQKVILSNEEKEIISLLSDGGLHIEKISSLLNKQVFLITPILSVLEIKGLVLKSGNIYQLTRNDLEV